MQLIINIMTPVELTISALSKRKGNNNEENSWYDLPLLC